ncbi:hypothetical protein QN277_029394 [Acacia crassicarpa]|uniref:Cleavage and polyadenylation specificity factor subunit 3-II n=1 Tax=Acacia crassicarpa TaxID=499986 RepID=A0AAE1MJF4_9FABA|nr:hypothetical protein QN277_029394 [Acacia crassicarpa]
MAIECLVLGAGQEVGKSCVVVTINGKRIMFDCGMHMGYLDHRRYPDFSRISKLGDFDNALTCIIITHFHLDHVGALPYFTEVCGFHGPVYMTYPTKALAPLMLEDYRKVMVDRRGEEEQFTSDHIAECMKKVVAVDLRQTVHVDEDLQIRAYYAGHVIGAAMFYVKVGDAEMVYTGDYNMTPDRHLGAAQIDRLRLDLVITESTYATTIRDSRYSREREFLKAVHKCVSNGGKVLIPTFALGRAQELCILLDDYWERTNLKVPIYFSAGLTIQANMYYKMLISWTSQKIKDSYSTHNAFDFKHVHNFERSMINDPGPCVLFATPGMISGGFSLEVFKRWAPSEKNLVTLPGYCVAGTIGHKLMSGKPTKIDLDQDTQIDVRCQVHQLAFSPHTDSKGASDIFIKRCQNPNFKFQKCSSSGAPGTSIQSCQNPDRSLTPRLQVKDERVAEGILVLEKSERAKVVHQEELLHRVGEKRHHIRFAYCCPVRVSDSTDISSKSDRDSCLQLLHSKLSCELSGGNIQNFGENLQMDSFHISVCPKDYCPYRIHETSHSETLAMYFCCFWEAIDEKLAWRILSAMENLDLREI